MAVYTMEVPTKWSRASVISFIKGLGKHAGVCAPTGMFASFDLSGFTQTGPCQGDSLRPGISLCVSPLE